MATKISKSARYSLTLNAGTNPVSGATIKKTLSISKIVPGSDAEALSDVAAAIGTVLSLPIMLVGYVETSQII